MGLLAKGSKHGVQGVIKTVKGKLTLYEGTRIGSNKVPGKSNWFFQGPKRGKLRTVKKYAKRMLHKAGVSGKNLKKAKKAGKVGAVGTTAAAAGTVGYKKLEKKD